MTPGGKQGPRADSSCIHVALCSRRDHSAAWCWICKRRTVPQQARKIAGILSVRKRDEDGAIGGQGRNRTVDTRIFSLAECMFAAFSIVSKTLIFTNSQGCKRHLTVSNVVWLCVVFQSGLHRNYTSVDLHRKLTHLTG